MPDLPEWRIDANRVGIEDDVNWRCQPWNAPGARLNDGRPVNM